MTQRRTYKNPSVNDRIRLATSVASVMGILDNAMKTYRNAAARTKRKWSEVAAAKVASFE